MNETPNQPSTDCTLAVPNTNGDPFWDALDAKDVYFSNDPTGELAMQEKVPIAFETAGYKIRTWGKADTHPCWILRARRRSAPRFTDSAQLLAHVIEVLRSAGVRARKADVTIDRCGDAIRVSFLWPIAVRAWHFDENSVWAPDAFAS